VSQAPVPASQIDVALQRVRRAVLLTFAVCAAVIAVAAPSGPGTPPASGFPIAAIGLGLASVLSRQLSVAAPARVRVYLSLASLLLAGGIGLVGVALALQGGPRATGLAYALGGAILCLRPPARLAPK
jgi:hypothetical protein